MNRRSADASSLACAVRSSNCSHYREGVLLNQRKGAGKTERSSTRRIHAKVVRSIVPVDRIIARSPARPIFSDDRPARSAHTRSRLSDGTDWPSLERWKECVRFPAERADRRPLAPIADIFAQVDTLSPVLVEPPLSHHKDAQRRDAAGTADIDVVASLGQRTELFRKRLPVPGSPSVMRYWMSSIALHRPDQQPRWAAGSGRDDAASAMMAVVTHAARRGRAGLSRCLPVKWVG